MDELVRNAWLPIFRMYDSAQPPSWIDFKKRFSDFFVEEHPMHIDRLDGAQLRRTLQRMRSKSAPGCDGWRVDELKLLPVVLLDRLGMLLNLIEDTGAWPKDLTTGTVSLISKGEGTSPLSLRPLGIMSVVYRLWAGTRVREVLAWQELWLDSGLHGFRKGHAAEDVWWEQALHVEEALLKSGSLFGLSLDYGKCFDRIPVHIVMELAIAAGMPQRLVKPLRSLYARLTRRFRVGRGIGQEFKSTNGIIQGCPLSVILLNLLVNVWARAVKAEVPAACPSGYADDTGATSSKLEPMQGVLNVTGHFAKLTGQVLNAGKSHSWCTSAGGRRQLGTLTLMGKEVPATTGGRLLGAHISFQGGVRNLLGECRVERGITVCERIRWAPLPMHVRANLLASLVLPSSLYGFSVSGLTCSLVDSLTSAVMRALWGTTRKLRSKEIVLSLLVPGHLVDPRQAAVYQCLRSLRRFVTKRVDLKDVVARLWFAHVHAGAPVPGPVGQVFKAVAHLGWQWVSVDTFRRPGRNDLPLCEGPDTWWDHEIREGLRLARWSEAASKRADMQGLDSVAGIDRRASLAVLRQCKGAKLGMMRAILVGSIRLQKRLFDAKIKDSPTCTFCGHADETLDHCFWECCRWDEVRKGFDLPSADHRASWPACTRECGLFLESTDVVALSRELADEELILRNFAAHLELGACRNNISVQGLDTGQIIWTDGACSHNQDDRFRRAGSGVFYGTDHVLNWFGMLPGLRQSNQRAELFAVLVACLRDPRPLDIRTDSDWVCQGVASLPQWIASGWPGEHSDLWNLLGQELACRACLVSVSWVKGHAKEVDVKLGRTTREDKAGNDGADKLAVSGAALHPVGSEVVAAASVRRHAAVQTHRMMLAILLERNSHEQQAADRGSEMGEPGDLNLDIFDDIPVPDAVHVHVHDCSDTEDLHAAVNMNLLDDDFEEWEGIQSDV